jgi:hypothetical protein
VRRAVVQRAWTFGRSPPERLDLRAAAADEIAMRLARRLALPAALCALLALVAALSPAVAAASETCTTAVGGPAPDRPAAEPLFAGDAPLATTCAAAVLNVSPNPAAPNALVTLDGSQSVGADVGNPIAGYQWDFGDGTTDQTAPPTASVTHTYARGAYTARLTIVDRTNAVLATTAVGLFADDPPVAALSAPSGTLRPGVAYGFDASGSSTPDAALRGSIVRYDWDWGDGTTTSNGGPRAQHTFASDATPRVTVTVYDDLGVSGTTSASVTVFNELPLVTLVATPSTVQVGQQVRLDASGSSDPDGSIVEYRWDLDANGSFETSTGTTPTATAGGFPNPGLLTLSVKVIDDSGGSSVKSVTVTVVAPPGSGGSGSGSRAGGSAGAGGSGGSGGSAGGGGTHDRFAVGLSGAAIQKLTAALRRGIGLLAVANRAATGKLTMTVSAGDARTLHLPGRRGRRPVAIGTLRLALRAGRTAKPTIKLTPGAARALRRVKPRALRVTIRGSLAAGTDSAAVVRVVLLRS